MMLRVYVAAPLAFAEEAAAFARKLEDAGVEVASRWHGIVAAGAKDPPSRRLRTGILMDNLADLATASAVVAYVPAGARPRATLGEVHHALAAHRPVFWCGSPPEEWLGTFDAHPKLIDVGSLAAALTELLAMRAAA